MVDIDGKPPPKLRRGEYRVRKTIEALRFRRDVLRSLVLRRGGVRGPDGLPVPPESFVYAVAGTCDLSWFLESGARAYKSLVDILRDSGVLLTTLTAVLDFGCGCGRVARYWKSAGPVRIYGVDINPHLVKWSARYLGFGEFMGNGLRPPLEFAAGTFDLVYAFSVFTHLSEEVQVAWMSEFERVLRPGGHLVVSTHGETAALALPGQLRRRFAAGQLVVTDYGPEGGNDCNAFHPRRYFETVVARQFAGVAFRPEGAIGNPPQDLYLLQRP